MKEGTITIKTKNPSKLPNIHIGHKIMQFLNELHEAYDREIDLLALKTARMLDRSRLAM